MRLLITTDTVGGVWTFTQELVCGLLEREACVSLVSFGRAPLSSQRRQCDELKRRFGRRFSYAASDIPLEWMVDNAEAFRRGAELLERQAALSGAGLLHSNQFCYGAVGLRIPRVVSAHSDVLSWAQACRSERLPATLWLERYVEQVQAGLTSATAVAAPTRWMLNALGENFDLPDWRLVIPNGRAVPPSFNRPRELRAIVAGRLWDEAKGVSILDDVAKPIPIAIAGESQFEQPGRPLCKGAAQLLGLLSQIEMLELFRDSAIYLCPSIYEPFGLSALEAARCGCAVVARDIPSLREVWDDAAIYFTDAGSLSEVLEQLARDPQLLEDARRRSFERSLFYSRDRMVDMYLALFRQVQAQAAGINHAA